VLTENGHTALKTTGINFACLIKVKQYSKSSNPLMDNDWFAEKFF
jgi:hypothetical protein